MTSRAKRRKHSEKPEEAFAMIEAVAPKSLKSSLRWRREHPGAKIRGSKYLPNAPLERSARSDDTLRGDVGP